MSSVFVQRVRDGDKEHDDGEMRRSGRDDGAAGYLGWFFLGGLIGAAAALLLTPRTGPQTREILAEHGGRVRPEARRRSPTRPRGRR